MSGWVTLQREMMDHPLFKGDSARLGAWVWLITRAAWKPTRFNNRGQIITLKRGQLCAGRDYLASEWGWSPSAVSRFLTRLETEQMIGQQTGQGVKVVSICNYAKYQDMTDPTGQQTEQQSEQQPDSNRTHIEQVNKGTIELNTDSIGVLTRETRKKTKPKMIPIPTDWTPDPFNPSTKSAKIVDGWPPGHIAEQVQLFADHHKARGNEWSDWQAAWRTWVTNSDKFRKERQANGSATHTSRRSGGGQPVGNAWLRAAVDAANGQPPERGFDP